MQLNARCCNNVNNSQSVIGKKQSTRSTHRQTLSDTTLFAIVWTVIQQESSTLDRIMEWHFTNYFCFQGGEGTKCSC